MRRHINVLTAVIILSTQFSWSQAHQAGTLGIDPTSHLVIVPSPDDKVHLAITVGSWVGEKYEESGRLGITVKRDSLINDVLAEIRKSFPDRKFIDRYGESLYLVDPETDKRLEESKKVSDYPLKDGSVLRLFTDIK